MRIPKGFNERELVAVPAPNVLLSRTTKSPAQKLQPVDRASPFHPSLK